VERPQRFLAVDEAEIAVEVAAGRRDPVDRPAKAPAVGEQTFERRA
jgi:hypothetical protein